MMSLPSVDGPVTASMFRVLDPGCPRHPRNYSRLASTFPRTDITSRYRHSTSAGRCARGRHAGIAAPLKGDVMWFPYWMGPFSRVATNRALPRPSRVLRRRGARFKFRQGRLRWLGGPFFLVSRADMRALAPSAGQLCSPAPPLSPGT